ncbi:hypothetical protein DFR74_10266 [Nocardia puris]|uniref:Uncharacterized protein n=1 Tax=Nocardia puris TaxID=208602 RepID=A0A366DU85_9NOCA|nr:hypothetical protein DFR74_10266 [Nocardia puris]
MISSVVLNIDNVGLEGVDEIRVAEAFMQSLPAHGS